MTQRRRVATRQRYPRAANPRRVGRYPALAKAGAGYFWDELLEYRVWCHPERGAPDLHDGNDYFYAFPNYPAALRFSKRTRGAEQPLALIKQKQHVNEPEPGVFLHVKTVRVAEWRVEWLAGSRRRPDSIRRFLATGKRR
jgi:putative acetyltransferase